MPQIQLPIFPAGTEEINRNVGVHCKDGKVVYVHGHLPVYQHKTSNLKQFRFFTSQMIDTGAVKTGEVAKAFGVTLATVTRYWKVYREEGPEGFFQQRQRAERLPLLVGDDADALAGKSVKARCMRLRNFDAAGWIVEIELDHA